MVNVLHNSAQFILDGIVQIVSKGEIIGLVAELNNLLGQLLTALPTLTPYVGEDSFDSELSAFVSN